MSVFALGHSMQQHQSCTDEGMHSGHGTIQDGMQALRVRCACKHFLMLPGHASASTANQKHLASYANSHHTPTLTSVLEHPLPVLHSVAQRLVMPGPHADLPDGQSHGAQHLSCAGGHRAQGRQRTLGAAAQPGSARQPCVQVDTVLDGLQVLSVWADIGRRQEASRRVLVWRWGSARKRMQMRTLCWCTMTCRTCTKQLQAPVIPFQHLPPSSQQKQHALPAGDGQHHTHLVCSSGLAPALPSGDPAQLPLLGLGVLPPLTVAAAAAAAAIAAADGDGSLSGDAALVSGLHAAMSSRNVAIRSCCTCCTISSRPCGRAGQCGRAAAQSLPSLTLCTWRCCHCPKSVSHTQALPCMPGASPMQPTHSCHTRQPGRFLKC